MSKAPRFIHLRTHTEHSLLEGAIPLKQLVQSARETKKPAVAVTDTNNMFCALEFSLAAKAAGVQPILGCQISVAYDEGNTAPIVLLAQTEQGYANLMKLSSCLYIGRSNTLPQLSMGDLATYHSDLICLSGGAQGPLGSLICANQLAKAHELAQTFSKIYPNRFYIELQRHPGQDGNLPEPEARSEAAIIELAYKIELPLVATNDAYFLKPDMYEAHDALICIAEGAYVDQNQPRRRLTPQHYLKSESEMCALFADLPEALENTVEIARRCAFAAYKRPPILPKFADNEVAELRHQAHEGLSQRLKLTDHSAPVSEYTARLDFELDVIEKMGFPGYFLIVADFIKWAKSQNIPVGPGRGSGAGSLVAYALTITDLDPLRFNLLFERFLNPERVSMPDFDIDFCMERREDVISYVQNRYGRKKVGQIITFGALLSKAAIRDVGRVLQLPYSQVDRLSKLVPIENTKPVSIIKALADEPRLREAAKEEVVDRLLSYAQKLEGLLRNASTHAAGVVIGDRPLDELVPLYQDPRSDMPATQFNMKWVEQAGLVKFDFLGLKTLTVIQNAVELLKKRGISLDITQIPLDDEKTYTLYASARTTAVFQVESPGMMDALRRMKPTCIEDIVALVALYRPGPMENIPAYCEVKNGLRSIESIHPTIDHILKETQGIIVYQEQVMQIAQVMAGYSLGGADLLRRAMGKKIAEEMAQERPKFIEGAAKTHEIDKEKAGEVFDLLEKFANYGFNKSHAAAYALVSYQTAWLKANYPVEFMAAVMNCDIHLTEKLAIYKREVDRCDIGVVPPCVNRSKAVFDVQDGQVLYALGALKNVGVEAMHLIIKARDANGPFRSVFDFARRVELKRIGKRSLEMLVRAGAFDLLEANRARLFKSLDSLVAYSNTIHEAEASNQVSLFGDTGDDIPEARLANIEDWLPLERLVNERLAIGFYLSGHPLDDYMTSLERRGVKTLSEISKLVHEGGPMATKIAGAVSGKKERKSAKGNRFAFVQLSDPTGLYEVTVFSDVLEKTRSLLEPGSSVVLSVKAEPDGEDGAKFLAIDIEAIDVVAEKSGPFDLKVNIDTIETVPLLAKLLGQQTGKNKAHIKLCVFDDTRRQIEILLPKPYWVTPRVKSLIRAVKGVSLVEEM